MTRCLTSPTTLPRAAACLLLTLTAALIAPAASAQSTGIRPFPADALRGTLVVTEPPQVLVNGRPAQLSPGARIRDAQNMLVLSGGLVGKKLVVNYQRDAEGQIHQAWILTPAEARLTRPTSAQ